MSTGGTGKHLKANGVECEIVLKIQEGRPNIGDMVKNGDIAMMLITSTGLFTSLHDIPPTINAFMFVCLDKCNEAVMPAVLFAHCSRSLSVQQHFIPIDST